MRIFLDDVRDPNPDTMDDVVVIRTAKEAMSLVRTGVVSWISFDHDLGTKLSGYDVAKLIEQLVWDGSIICPKWEIHSANPVGRANITKAMENASKWYYGIT